ncbi:MAG: Cu(I)/Ag(I) efflux system membrane fusion protein [Planctomycetota bacterium]|jgi:Cu(I)/Ag(I) efflux system membrane fusion protein
MTSESPKRPSLIRIFASQGITLLLILLAVYGGWHLRGGLAPASSSMPAMGAHEAHMEPVEKTMWSCSMHPQIMMPEFGSCPLCGMDLIPLESSSGSDPDSLDRRIQLSEDAQTLARIQTHPVERRFVQTEVRMVGKIQVDETRLAHLTAWAPGRLERLFVDYTGVEVAAGDHMVSLYSPKIYTDQSALLSALAAKRSLPFEASPMERESISATVDAARERLRKMGLNATQIKLIEISDAPTDHMTIYAPIGGVVVDKNAQTGMYVEEGTRIYTIADLSHLWLQLDAYESDLVWLRYGQSVEFTAEAFPGQVFQGTIAFLARKLDPVTQTIKVRVNLDNPKGVLRPGMFVRAVVRTKMATEGRVMDNSLAGKWICSMHPEVVESDAGICRICEMDLATTESLGYVPSNIGNQKKPLVIPATAPLRTGRRAVVYVEIESDEGPTYEGREILLGPRSGDWYLVASGLEEGERVVTNGNFKLDSALQILAKPSMMSASGIMLRPESKLSNSTPEPESIQPNDSYLSDLNDLEPIVLPEGLLVKILNLRSVYFLIHRALYDDDIDLARTFIHECSATVNHRILERLEPDTRRRWRHFSEELLTTLEAMQQTLDGEEIREHFVQLSKTMRGLLLTFNQADGVYEAECPMAFDDGARWLQQSQSVENPYFDGYMKICGTVLGPLAESEQDDE